VAFSSLRFADVVLVAPEGRIDHASAEPLQQALAPIVGDGSGDTQALLLDFSCLEYISSVGLRVVMMASKQLRARQARIAVAGMQPVVLEIFQITRFNHVVEIFPSVAEALAALSAPAAAAYQSR